MAEHVFETVSTTIHDRVTSEMLAFDVGANNGFTTSLLCAQCRQVVAFEPNPTLAAGLASLGLPNVKVEAMAVSNNVGTATFHIDTRPDLGGVASSLIENIYGLEGFTRPIEVPTVTLDHYCEQTGLWPDFVKIDVEGYEPQVFEGGRNLFTVRKPIILFEFWESHYDRFKMWFDILAHTHELIRTGDGVSVRDWYARNAGGHAADILAIPL